MMVMRSFGLILALPLFAVTSMSAQAQSGGASALKGHDSNAPVDVSANRIEVQDRADRAIFAGNVHVTQGALTLDTQRLTVAYSNQGGVQIQRLDAAGGVTVKSPSETARGNFGIYDLDRKLITLIGAVELVRGQNKIFGQRLTIDLTTGRAVVDGGPAGVNQSGGRVRGHFTVPKRGTN
jgi:lipopolysaccharide export system protein LptA